MNDPKTCVKNRNGLCMRAPQLRCLCGLPKYTTQLVKADKAPKLVAPSVKPVGSTKELTTREQDILKVPPIIWDSMFGGFLFQLDTIRADIDTLPDTSKQNISELREVLAKLRIFMVKGDTPDAGNPTMPHRETK